MPTPSTYQTNSMPMGPGGLSPGLDDDGFISNIALRFRIVAKTAAYTVKDTESGTIFTTEGATAAVVFTLPDPAAVDSGTFYIFYNAEDFDMTVTSGATDEMVAFNDDTADGVAFSTTSEKIGGAILVFGNGTLWYAAGLLGQDSQTITVAT